MVLLEKTRGNNFINKMRAICLLEANFNYFNKTIFTRRMMASAQDRGQIPTECFSKKGSNCVNGVITNIMYCNESQTHHHPMCIGGNNFGNCYDCIAHPPASIALQSLGVSCKAIGVLLLAMQTMRFLLCMGYGESSLSYGGLEVDWTLGLGQGNAVAGPGFLALSLKIVHAYVRDGHGSWTVTSYSRTPSQLVAVIYVDDTDLIHTSPSVTASPAELIANFQKSTNVWGGLAIATGASLKPEKCFAYFMVYKFLAGRATLGSIRTLPTSSAPIPQIDSLPLPSHLTVPLPDGSTAPIPTLPPAAASYLVWSILSWDKAYPGNVLEGTRRGSPVTLKAEEICP
jgi:hypothetical protein